MHPGIGMGIKILINLDKSWVFLSLSQEKQGERKTQLLIKIYQYIDTHP